MPHELPEYTAAALEQQAGLDVARFTKEDAFALGSIAGGVILEWNLNLAVDIIIGDDLVYRAKFGTTGTGNDQWLAGKAAAATHFGVSSLLVRLRHEESGVDFASLDLDHDRVKAHGGSVPIRVDGNVVGTITMSGEPDVVDHEACWEAVTRYRASLS